MLCAVPLLRGLRTRFPNASVTLIAGPVNVEVMRNNRYVDNIINYDKREFLLNGKLHPVKLARFIGKLRSEKYDVAIVPSTVSTSFTSDMLAYLSGAAVRIGASGLDGRKNPSAFFFNAPVDLDWRNDPHRPQTERNLDVARGLSVVTNDLSSEITLTSQELAEGKLLADRMKKSKRILVGFHPGAGKTQNRWPAAWFAEVANALADEFNAQILVTAGPMDDEPLKNMINRLGIPFELLQNEPIRRVASIILYVNLFVTNDTGIMHVAGATGTSVLSLFGPTDPEQWAPYGGRNRYIAGKGGRIDVISIQDVLQCARQLLSWRDMTTPDVRESGT